MGNLKEKVATVLKESFEGAEPELEINESADKLGGFLIWEDFEGEPQIDRQKQVWTVLRSRLDREEQRKISAILTVSPAEMAVMRDDA